MSIRAIADEVGVSPPAIYLHFADKDELLFAVCARHFAALDERVVAAVEGIDDPVEKLRVLARAYVQFGLDQREPYRILFMGNPHGVPEHIDVDELRSTPPFSRLVDAVEEAIAADAIDDADPLLVATGLWAMVHGVTSLAISMSAFPAMGIDALLDHVCHAQLAGLGDVSAPAARPRTRATPARPRSPRGGGGRVSRV